MKSAFNATDVDGEGALQLEQWIVIMKGLGFDTAHAKTTFEAMNTNKDDKVTPDEFADYHYEYFFSPEDKLNSSILFGPLD